MSRPSPERNEGTLDARHTHNTHTHTHIHTHTHTAQKKAATHTTDSFQNTKNTLHKLEKLYIVTILFAYCQHVKKTLLAQKGLFFFWWGKKESDTKKSKEED